MRYFLKIAAASIVFAGCTQTAFAGAADIAFTPATKIVSQKTAKVVKTTVNRDTVLPKAQKVRTDDSKTMLFYSASPTRTKVMGKSASATRTPNLFKK